MSTAETGLKVRRRSGRLACPVCRHETDGQPVFTQPDLPSEEEGWIIRTFQHFICDTPSCPVGSFRVEWREVTP